MGRNDTTAAIVDSLLKLALSGAILTAILVVPNVLSALDKPLKKQLDRLDKKGREREIRRVVSYMKSQKLLSGSYKHGLQITERGRRRLSKIQLDRINIDEPRQWDGTWRVVFYDIPEDKRTGRRALTAKLQGLVSFSCNAVCLFILSVAVKLSKKSLPHTLLTSTSAL